MWTAILVASGGCYALKLAGLSVPARVLEGATSSASRRVLPVALLAALIAINTFSTGTGSRSTRAPPGSPPPRSRVGLRAPFLVVVALATLATALARLACGG